jgi:hypothetical protein
MIFTERQAVFFVLNGGRLKLGKKRTGRLCEVPAPLTLNENNGFPTRSFKTRLLAFAYYHTRETNPLARQC